jgi:hypothetical protein
LLLGHRSLNTTSRYLRIATSKVCATASPLDSLQAITRSYRTSCPPDGGAVSREGLEVADVFRHFGPAFRDQHGASLSAARRRAMTAIESCRTAELGGHVDRCDECGHQRVSYNSCRNRNCPKCQGLARAQWLEDRQTELLDAPYFHVGSPYRT